MTRWRLTVIYAGVISLLLNICGFEGCEGIAQSHQGSIEVQSELGKGSTRYFSQIDWKGYF